MQTYLKTRPVWSQALIFFSLVVFGLLIFVGMIGSVVASKVSGLGLFEISNTANWNLSDPRYSLLLRVFLAMQFLGVFLAPVLVFAYLSTPKPLSYLGLRKTPVLFFILGILVMVAALPLVEYLGLLNQKMDFPDGVEGWMKTTEEEAQQQIRMLLQGRSFSNLLLNIVMVAGFAGIGEELLFRGVVQRLAIWGFKNVWVGIVFAAFLFSAFHLQFYGFFPRFLLGILLGALYWYSGSLWPAIVAHFFYDALLITLAYFNPELLAAESASLLPEATTPVIAGVSLLLVGGLVFFMRRISKASKTDFMQERSTEPPQNFTFEP